MSGAIGVVIGVSVVMIWNERSRVKPAREVTVEIASVEPASELSVEQASKVSVDLASEVSVELGSEVSVELAK